MFNNSSRLGTTTDSDAADNQAANQGLPTIVLVHGAWADSSSWEQVIDELLHAGFPVQAIANPLRGVEHDTAYLASYLAAIEGPVVLVGHSYGGAIITNIDTSAFDVRALVYVAAFIPIAGETVGQLAAQSSTPLPLVTVETPSGPEVHISPEGFRAAFAADVDQRRAGVLGIVQRPANVRAVAEPISREAFRTVPAYVLVTTADRAIDPDVQRMMAHRTGAAVVEVEASHAVMVSRPSTVAGLILQAATSAVTVR
ncbi:alpha/beta fold hydrolase [Arthrobacter sp. zg-Y1110]|uniref:alpha/beta fold hydrolase n=1 Tax=Arthrobacter sp. zg-Y1110 TaxID=2886932 RepID=UPI001D13801E|nr:alpha/beta hydrolase [Arthrobacter sp. zg-Y1110]MCC3290911.1 alpha/beta hydrolase [Arthrobacter sp. zg-Y1110]UWX86325.1 alpha/beta hydrolase [Arthrobacter sp. zg-Y1110]